MASQKEPRNGRDGLIPVSPTGLSLRTTMASSCIDFIKIFQRLESMMAKTLEAELQRLGVPDLTASQALLIYELGEDQLTIGDLTSRGAYLATNISYILRKLVSHGYVVQRPSLHDKRSTTVKLTPKGMQILDKLNGITKKYQPVLTQMGPSSQELEATFQLLQTMDLKWSQHLQQR